MDKSYKGSIEDKEFEDCVKEYVLTAYEKSESDLVNATIEASGRQESIDPEKEREIIEKLRKKTGIAGLGMAGTPFMMLLLMGFNMM